MGKKKNKYIEKIKKTAQIEESKRNDNQRT
jgi:hypothetical protein